MANDESSLSVLAEVAPEASVVSNNDDDEQVLELKRKRNREHARLSRQRKRQRVEVLQEDNDALRRSNTAVIDENARLRDRLSRAEHEIHRLRSWIEHAAAPYPGAYPSVPTSAAPPAWRQT